MKKTAIYAGTFDPITLGHVDLVERASRIFGKVILAVVETSHKKTLFDAKERVAMAREVAAAYPNVEVDCFDGLLVEYARKRKVTVLVRGLRAFSDFEYEFQMALTNRKLAPEIETIFLMPKETHSYISSSLVRDVALLGGNVKGFVPACVRGHIRRYLAGRKKA